MISGQVNIFKIVNIWLAELAIRWPHFLIFSLKLSIELKFLIFSITMSYTIKKRPFEELKPYWLVLALFLRTSVLALNLLLSDSV